MPADPPAEREEEPGTPVEPEAPDWAPAGFHASGEDDLSCLRAHWGELVSHCAMLQPGLRRHLRDSWPVSVTDTVVRIGFDPEFKEEIEEVRAMDHGTLHTLFTRLLGRSVRLELCVLDKPVTWSHVSGGGGGNPEEPFRMETAGTDPAEWLKNETVRKVLEIFNGDLVDIQPSIPTQGETENAQHDENDEASSGNAEQNAKTAGRTG